MHTCSACCLLSFRFLLLPSYMDSHGACVSADKRLIHEVLKAHDHLGHVPISRKEIYCCWDPIKSSSPKTCWSTDAGGAGFEAGSGSEGAGIWPLLWDIQAGILVIPGRVLGAGAG